VLVPAYWWQYGAVNFLWGSDVALLVCVPTHLLLRCLFLRAATQ
jgi:hypothetical protein